MTNGIFYTLRLLVFLLILIFFLSVSFTIAQNKQTFNLTKTDQINAATSVVKFNINNISTYIYADGRMDINGTNSGFEFPKGSNKYCVYESGFLWGGISDGIVYLGGSSYPSGLVPGVIMENGQSQNISDPKNRIFRSIRKYWDDVLDYESQSVNIPKETIIDQYETDSQEWPAELGAPFEDINNNGKYDAGYDIPGIPGADQTIWFAANNSDPDKSGQLYGSLPTDIEMQVTIWGYNFNGSLRNTIFKKYILINKSNRNYENLFATIWCDPDLGNAMDDLIACDTILNMGYAYNANETDENYNNNPPASGYLFLSADENVINPIMKSFAYIFPDYAWDDDFNKYRTEFYNYLQQGRTSPLGEYYSVPEELGGGITQYPLSGDPYSGTGFLDSNPGDRRYMINTGPFYFLKGDTLKFVLAQIAAGATMGVNNIEAVSLLKEYAKYVKYFFDHEFKIPHMNIISGFYSDSFEGRIRLSWTDESEVFQSFSYKFQGYNIYQLPYRNAQLSEGIKIKTFDVIDGIKAITENFYNSEYEIITVVQSGNDTGIENELTINHDYIHETDLYAGKEYYYAVTAYNYSDDAWIGQKSFESEPRYVSVTFGENQEYDIEKINVFPNPYYGANPNEINKYQRYVTFSHLPEKATIRIFNLAGHLIKTIHKTEPGQFQRWDLMNENYYLVPGGIYIAYIEMPELGQTTILKLAIITEKIIPDYY